jgi:glycosyltransferase involved in cell wall biosynthesis
MKLNVVLRTCDRTSIESNRIVPKPDCVVTCFNSLVKSLRKSSIDYHIHIIDDASSDETVNKLIELCPEANIHRVPYIEQDPSLNSVQKSRRTVKIAYDYIMELPDDELVYMLEDDYLHFEDSIQNMIDAWKYFTDFLDTNIVIFPQDFNQHYLHRNNPVGAYYVRRCLVFNGPDRYYRTVWYTHESFLLQASLVKKYKDIFYTTLSHGTDGSWEGSTLSNIWTKEDVVTLMPLGTLAIHMGQERDISFYVDWKKLWNQNIYK